MKRALTGHGIWTWPTSDPLIGPPHAEAIDGLRHLQALVLGERVAIEAIDAEIAALPEEIEKRRRDEEQRRWDAEQRLRAGDEFARIQKIEI